MTASKVGSIVRGAGAGERLWFYGGGLHTWKATSAETGGAFLLFEDVMSRGKTTPLHTHPQVDEALYVLEGELLFHIDGEEQRVGSGGVAMAARGVPHAFLVTSDTARILCLETPGSSEAFYRGASEPATAELERLAPVDFARVRESAERNGGIEILGPPPFKIV
jgi:quercetin dioxygenase-like cupin family protein